MSSRRHDCACPGCPGRAVYAHCSLCVTAGCEWEPATIHEWPRNRCRRPRTCTEPLITIITEADELAAWFSVGELIRKVPNVAALDGNTLKEMQERIAADICDARRRERTGAK